MLVLSTFSHDARGKCDQQTWVLKPLSHPCFLRHTTHHKLRRNTATDIAVADKKNLLHLLLQKSQNLDYGGHRLSFLLDVASRDSI